MIALRQTIHEVSVFHVNLRFFQNITQTIRPVHFTKFGMQQTACAMRFILEAFIVV